MHVITIKNISDERVLIHVMRRNRDEIIGDILEAIDREINRISSIMKNVNLSATLAKKYLSMLIDEGLIKNVNGEYRLTEKGRKVLEQIRDIRRLELELAAVLYEIRKELVNNGEKNQIKHSS